MKEIKITGQDLKIEELQTLVSHGSVNVSLATSAMARVKKSRRFLESQLKGRVVYGVNTGFGPMASHILSDHNLYSLQANLIRSHAVGMGDPLTEAQVLASMVVRLNTLAKGFSGASPELLKRLELYINKRIIPVIPEHGAVGTSGDLVQLAHIALALMGEGEVLYKGKRRKTKDILKLLQINPYELKPKEGLSLINGTSAMSGIAALNIIEAERILKLAVENGAWALELVNAYSDSLDSFLHKVRPHEGQGVIAGQMRAILADSKLLRERAELNGKHKVESDVEKIPDTVQEVYSLRCIPQILGPIYEVIKETKRKVEIEINSVTDNPVIHYEKGNFLHGGNFHGDYISSAMDFLKIVIVKLTMLTERRTNFFLNENVNKKFPPFLNLKKPGLTLGLQGLQFVATSTTAQSQTLAFPQYVHSIPTNADNQDLVSMGTDSALLAARVLENADIVLSIESIALAQATDFLGNQNKLSTSAKNRFKALRKVMQKVVEDRVLVEELPKVISLTKQ